MKKAVFAFLCYVIFACAVVFGYGFFRIDIPNILESVSFSYKVSNGLATLFNLMPSICFTGFLLGCSLSFGDYSPQANTRFSSGTANLFKRIVFMSLAITFVISLSTLVFKPYQKIKQETMRNLPITLNEYISLSQKYLLLDSPEHALQYIQKARAIDPSSQRVADLARKVELAEKDLEGKRAKERSLSYTQTNFNSQKKIPDFFDESKMSVEEMLEKARSYFDERNFFAAHYFATNASRLCNEDDSNLVLANALADEAWKQLERAQKEEDTDGYVFFRNKLRGHSELLKGNFVEAYYIFYGLSQEDARKERDPDVMRYLELAEKRVLENYFFIDETYDLSAFENAGNVYFTLPQPQGGYDIVLVRGVTDIEGSGGLVRYLRDLQIYSFDKNGRFLYSMKTPYAKMSAVKVEDLDVFTRSVYASGNGVKIIPELKLCSLSRSVKGERNAPQYDFPEDSMRDFAAPNLIYLPMPYQDFSMIAHTFVDNDKANPFLLSSLLSRAPGYGYSLEWFSFSTLNKIFYPFMTLILLIFTAIIAWNYRLEAGAIFKFKWIFILPLFNLVFYFISSGVEYIVQILNYVFISVAGTTLAFWAGILVYLIMLIAVSIVFVARKGD